MKEYPKSFFSYFLNEEVKISVPHAKVIRPQITWNSFFETRHQLGWIWGVQLGFSMSPCPSASPEEHDPGPPGPALGC